MQCASCGHEIESGSRFCVECGAPLDAESKPEAAPPSAPVPKWRAMRWAFTVAVVSYVLFASLLYWSPEIRQEFLSSCECEPSQAIKTLAGLFPVWFLVLWIGRAVTARVHR